MSSLEDAVDSTAHDTSFSGVVRVDRPDEEALIRAYGLADRAHGIASGSKAFTALAVMSLVEEGVLALSTTARSLLGTDLPQVADDVTVEHLLAHRSGIGDYLDDDADISEYPMSVPVHRLETAEQFRAVLDGHPTLFPAGEHFSYCNGSFVLLALLAERSSGTSYHDLVRRRVFAPAAMVDSDFLRTDDLPGCAALGYAEVDGAWRTNVRRPRGPDHRRRRSVHDARRHAPVLDGPGRGPDRAPGEDHSHDDPAQRCTERARPIRARLRAAFEQRRRRARGP